MKLKVTKDLCEIKENEIWNVGDYNVHTVQVELSPEFNGLVNKVRYFVEDKSYDMLITDNVAQVPYEATVMEGTIKIGVYGYDADTDILVQSTSPVNKYIASGTYTGEADNTEPLTPTDKQQMETAIQKNTDDIDDIKDDIEDLKDNKQNVLVSGENIKTINNESILGSGNIDIQVGADDYAPLTNKPKINNVELNGNKSLNELGIQPAGNYLTEETDPTVPNYVKNITQANITSWNNKSDFSGNYNDLSNKPSINNTTLSGNKTSSDLGLQPAGDYALKSEIPDVSDFITKNVNDLTYYYTKTEVDGIVSAVYKYKGTVSTYSDLPITGLTVGDVYNVETDGSNYAWTGTIWDKLGGDIDLSGYQTKITSSNKISADLISDGTTNKTVTNTEKNTWSAKYSKPSTGIPKTDLASVVQTSLGKADTAIQSSDLTNYVTNTDYADNITGGVIKIGASYGTSIASSGTLIGSVRTYEVYSTAGNYMLISKGTLENAITGKELDLKQLSTFDSTKTQVLKNINGTLTWVNE